MPVLREPLQPHAHHVLERRLLGYRQPLPARRGRREPEGRTRSRAGETHLPRHRKRSQPLRRSRRAALPRLAPPRAAAHTRRDDRAAARAVAVGIRPVLDDAVAHARVRGEALAPEHAAHVRERPFRRDVGHGVLPRETYPRARSRPGRTGRRPHLHAIDHHRVVGKHLGREPIDVRRGEGLSHRDAQLGQPRDALRRALRRPAVPLACREGPLTPAHRVPEARFRHRRRRGEARHHRRRSRAARLQGGAREKRETSR